MQVESANSNSAVVQLDMDEFREFLLIGVALSFSACCYVSLSNLEPPWLVLA